MISIGRSLRSQDYARSVKTLFGNHNQRGLKVSLDDVRIVGNGITSSFYLAVPFVRNEYEYMVQIELP
jgi:hypothetical protein